MESSQITATKLAERLKSVTVDDITKRMGGFEPQSIGCRDKEYMGILFSNGDTRVVSSDSSINRYAVEESLDRIIENSARLKIISQVICDASMNGECMYFC